MSFDIHLLHLVIFSIGLSIASGAAFLSALLFITSIRDKKISHDEVSLLVQSRKVVWLGTGLYILGGVGLFTLSAEVMLQLEIFYAAMTIAAIMLLNALVFHAVLLPNIKLELKGQPTERPPVELLNIRAAVLISEALAATSWLFLILHHAMYRADAAYFMVMGVFGVALALILGLFVLHTLQALSATETSLLRNTALGLIAFSAGCLFLSFNYFSLPWDLSQVGRGFMEDKKSETVPTTADSEVNTTYTAEEVAMHGNIEDCWVIIDGMVFDATPAAEKYPEVYKCGQDSTKEYRTVREEGISERVMSYKIGLLGFTLEEVASHKTKTDCWIVIDGLVFDMTEESKLHPAAFNCGTDASANYHRNHGEGISERQMKSHIGSLDDGVKSMFSGNPVEKREQLKPYRELYVKEGSWDTHELMAVVEKDPEKLLFIDGSKHTVVGRIHDIGFQPHTSVFSPDGSFMFIISRDGWLTKINLKTLEPMASLSVGESSRGTAITEDGKYLAVGNYIPGTIVMVDPVKMRILKEIRAVGEINGKEIESRLGAMIEDGDKIIAALKDLNSVWVIDTSKPDFPVIEKHWNIGDNKTPLHDAFLSADGRYYVVASMGSHTVWVMDTDTWKPIKEVKTGETPHTGPGATWGNKVYVPALGEGLITAIDMTTWEPVAYIKTAGPGLFIRSFNEDPDYPYVWTETAFGDFHDEIYVIDARIDKIVKTLKPVEGESSWHPEFTNNGKFVYIVSQTGNQVVVYDANSFEVVKRIDSATPSAVSNVGNRLEEAGL